MNFRFQPSFRIHSRAALPLLSLLIARNAGAAPGATTPGAATTPASATASVAVPVVISELRPSGPGGARDAFIELFNAGSKPLSLAGWSLRFEDEKGAPTSVKLAPGTRIGARGHLLLVGAAYSLQNLTKGDMRFEARVFGGVGLFDAKGKLIDAVGAANVPAMAREGAGLPVTALTPAQAKQPIPQYSYVRRALDGAPQDSGDNARDFVLISVTGSLFGQKTRIGVPGPEGAVSPRLRPAQLAATQVLAPDAPVATPARPMAQPVALQTDPERNSMRRARLEKGPLKKFGTMTLRYRLINDSALPIKTLWFRVADITCDPALEAPADIADIRLIRGKAAPVTAPQTAANAGGVNAGGVNAGATQVDGAGAIAADADGLGAPAPKYAMTVKTRPQRTLSVWKAKLATAPTQPLGGGLNALLQVELPEGGIAPGARGEVTFSFGVERTGNYRVVLSNERMNLVFEGHTEEDLVFGDGEEVRPGIVRNGMRSGTTLVRGGPIGAGTRGVAGASGAATPASDELSSDDSGAGGGLLIEGNTEDGVIIPPVKPSGNPS